jgi:hypothetical protein
MSTREEVVEARGAVIEVEEAEVELDFPLRLPPQQFEQITVGGRLVHFWRIWQRLGADLEF